MRHCFRFQIWIAWGGSGGKGIAIRNAGEPMEAADSQREAEAHAVWDMGGYSTLKASTAWAAKSRSFASLRRFVSPNHVLRPRTEPDDGGDVHETREMTRTQRVRRKYPLTFRVTLSNSGARFALAHPVSRRSRRFGHRSSSDLRSDAGGLATRPETAFRRCISRRPTGRNRGSASRVCSVRRVAFRTQTFCQSISKKPCVILGGGIC